MTTLRLVLFSVVLCGFAYTGAIHGFARIISPESAQGSLVIDADGRIIGSRLIAQEFASDRYFHPRPSACDWNARAAAGSNLSPTNPKLTERASTIVDSWGASADHPIPADLVAASGSGLDPDITEASARYQAHRVAHARGLDPALVLKTIESVKRPLMVGIGGASLVNVLELNLAIDSLVR